jgi:hypothetical protein
MTRRDKRWRVVGAALFAAAYGSTYLTAEDSALVIVMFIGGAIGVLLLLSGKKVMVAWQAERSGHRDTADAVHAARVRRRMDQPHQPAR